MSDVPPEPPRERDEVTSGGLRFSVERPRFITVGSDIDVETRREQTRRHVALILVILLATLAILLVVLVAADLLNVDQAKDLAASVLSPVVAVSGTALGFYFGAGREK